MSMQKEPRYRINAKQTAKNRWYFDATIEYGSDKIELTSGGTLDVADIKMGTLGMKLLSMIKEAEKAFKDDKRALVTDMEPGE